MKKRLTIAISILLALILLVGYQFYQKDRLEKQELSFLKTRNLTINEALPIYEELAEAGFHKAQNLLGEIYYFGLGAKENKELGLYYWQQAAEQNNVEAQIDLASHYFTEKEYDKSFKWYNLSAKSGYPTILMRLAEHYYSGLGTTTDFNKARELFLQVSETGNSDADFYLGQMYEMGKGVMEDEAKAIRYYRQAAENKNAQALNRLGEMKQDGKNIEILKFGDYALLSAKDFFREACDLGEKKACLWLQ